MASHSQIASFHVERFRQNHDDTSNNTIGVVMLRRQARDLNYTTEVTATLQAEGHESRTHQGSETTGAWLTERQLSRAEEKERIKSTKLEKRRAQVRVCQARFRQKQRDHMLHQQQRAKELREEIDCLQWERLSLTMGGRTKPSPFTIIGETLHFIDNCLQYPWRLANADVMENHIDTRRSLEFLHAAFAQDVALGDLHGFNVLLEQLRRYSQKFNEPRIQLECIETLAPGVLRANATFSMTISETTLRCVFHPLEHDDKYQLLQRESTCPIWFMLKCNERRQQYV